MEPLSIFSVIFQLATATPNISKFFMKEESSDLTRTQVIEFYRSNMSTNFQDKPKLGHITTFGGNPVIAAASLATLRELRDSNLISQIDKKEALFRKELKHPKIIEIRGKGLMLAAIVENEEMVDKIIEKCIKKRVLLFRLLWKKNALRISPPLTISVSEIKKGCAIIRQVLNSL